MEELIVKEEDLDLEEEKRPLFKKILITIMAVIIIFLMLSFTFAGYPIGGIIQGWFESNPVEDNQINLENFSIIFTEQTHQQLQYIYFSTQKTEFSVCLSGEKINENYYISSLYQPEMFEQTFNHVTFKPCSKETLIILHSHPYKSCLASDTDINTLQKNKEVNKDVLMVIMCEPDRFSVYD